MSRQIQNTCECCGKIEFQSMQYEVPELPLGWEEFEPLGLCCGPCIHNFKKGLEAFVESYKAQRQTERATKKREHQWVGGVPPNARHCMQCRIGHTPENTNTECIGEAVCVCGSHLDAHHSSLALPPGCTGFRRREAKS